MAYADAPPERYAWAPPDVRLSEAFPVDQESAVPPVPGSAVGPDVRAATATSEGRRGCVPAEPRTGVA